MMISDWIDCPLDVAVQNCPNGAAVFWGSRRMSFEQLNTYVNAAVRSLKERDIRPGQRVALVGDNSLEALIVCWALWRLGAVVCPINPKFPVDQIKDILTFLNVRSVIYMRSVMASFSKGNWSVIEITDLIVFEHKDGVSVQDQKPHPFSVNQEAVIILTSGTSALPKAAVLTMGNLYFNALGSNEAVPLEKDAVWLLSLPLFHVSGLGILWRCALAQSAIRIAAKEDVLRLVIEEKITHASLVLTQLVRLLEQLNCRKLKSLRGVLLGGGPFPEQLIAKALEVGLPVYVSYGLTEMASQVATGRLTGVNTLCVKVLPYRELTIDPDGEICLRGQTLFKGYWRGKEIVSPVDAQGWFHTGDLGCIDQQGCLQVLGRRDDMFICAGENIHPQEIEAVLGQIPGVLQAIVVPRHDHEFGQRPVAFIQWDNSQSVWPELKIVEYLVKKLPKLKIPVAFLAWPEVGLSMGLKVNRQELMKRYCDQRDRKI